MTNNELCICTKTTHQFENPTSLQLHNHQDYKESNGAGAFSVSSRKDLNFVLGLHS
jgi:hypothetical protein